MGFILTQFAFIGFLNLREKLIETCLDFDSVLFESHDWQKSLSTNLPHEVGATLCIGFDETYVLSHTLLSRFDQTSIDFSFALLSIIFSFGDIFGIRELKRRNESRHEKENAEYDHVRPLSAHFVLTLVI